MITEKSAWPTPVRPPSGAPNVLVILTDDVGYGASSTFGGPVPTPTMDRLAAQGLRFNRFHTAGICSPTRASLLTGRNPHRVNMGMVSNRPTSFDGYTSVIPKSAATVAQVLRQSGYATSMFGKWHLVPEWETSPAGPFDRWPTGMGFDYFFGFLGFDANMWAPALVENTSVVHPPCDDPSYHLENDLATRACDWLELHHAVSPEQPFFMYYSTGAAHSPHHAPRDWIDRFKGQFDDGWDALRDKIHQRQLSMGLIPANTRNTPRPEPLRPWCELSPDQQRLGARLMESYAANLAYADVQIGRVVETIEAIGRGENTLIIYVQGDNGGSAEGGFDGLLYEHSMFNRYEEDYRYFLDHIEDIGSERAYNHYPAGWAWALNAPFRYYKQVASHFGGTRNGMVMSWPARIREPGLRTQFHHVSDVLPTILQAAGIEAPAEVDGVPQDSLDGVSMMAAIDSASSSDARSIQIFECLENFGIYCEGWMACTTPKDVPWASLSTRVAKDPTSRQWELYDVRSDFSQSEDLSAVEPGKLAELQQLFWKLAEEQKILPIHPPTKGRENRPSRAADRQLFVYRNPVCRIPADAAPHTVGRSFSITAEVDIPQGGGRGVLVSHGGRFGGYALYLLDGELVFHYNAIGPNQYRIASGMRIPAGTHRLAVEFHPDTAVPGAGGAVRMDVNGEAIQRGTIGRTLRDFMNNESFNVGRDTLTPVSTDYTIAASHFNGAIRSIVVALL
jgi:arylsulfatase